MRGLREIKPRKIIVITEHSFFNILMVNLDLSKYKIAVFSLNVSNFNLDLSKITYFKLDSPNACLGQDFQIVVFDAEQGFSLDAFLCASSCLLAQGLLIIYLPAWNNLEDLNDWQIQRFDSSISTSPNFYAYLKCCLEQFTDLIIDDISYDLPQFYTNILPNFLLAIENTKTQINTNLSQEQQSILQVLNSILKNQQIRCLITGQRGSGKSTLIRYFLQNQHFSFQDIILCSARKDLIQYLDPEAKITFYSPDLLLQTVENSPDLLEHKLLIIEEAAILPLSLLKHFINHFSQIILITTLDNYEGTGLGLTHKLLTWQQFNHIFILKENMRFNQDDGLSQLTQKLGLLSNSTAEKMLLNLHSVLPRQKVIPQNINFIVDEKLYLQHLKNKEITEFYQLLFMTHYRTHPIDIRRLFDANAQEFILYFKNKDLVAGAWLLHEGNIETHLAQQIYLNVRRPKGNLSVQMLAAHNQAPEACSMRVMRISRIAVDIQYQQQGIGKSLVLDVINHAVRENIDYVSVVFGFEKHLIDFWQQCGFTWVHLGTHQDHITAEHAILMLYPLSEVAQKLTQKLADQFLLDQAAWHKAQFISPAIKTAFNQTVENNIVNQLNHQDCIQLHDLASSPRSLLANFPVLYRCYQYYNMNINQAYYANFIVHLTDFIHFHTGKSNILSTYNLSQKSQSLEIKKELSLLPDFIKKCNLTMQEIDH